MNEFIPAKDVGKVFLEDLKREFHIQFPDLIPGTEEYEKKLCAAANYIFRPLFQGDNDETI
jgi:hypothetical protein